MVMYELIHYAIYQRSYNTPPEKHGILLKFWKLLKHTWNFKLSPEKTIFFARSHLTFRLNRMDCHETYLHIVYPSFLKMI